ncbi:E3 ubiquitin/ISG15 ligase TRIM25-like [Lithobates pipiens]
MASAAVRDPMTCSVCWEIYKDPVTLPCGHNFCQDCIKKTWDNQEERESSCPECMQRYRNRPELKRNTRLRDLAEVILAEEKKSGISCTYCVNTPTPAVKSCLKCESSFCNKHLKVHSKSSDHVLTEPTSDLQNRECSVHKQTLEYYCVEDSTCICKSCMPERKQRGHTILTLSTASTKKKAERRLLLPKLMNKKEKMEKRIHGLKTHESKLQKKANGITERMASLFRVFRTQIEDLERRVLTQISAERELISSSGLINQLEIKHEALCKKIRHIEELHSITDPLAVIRELDRGDFCGDDDEGDNEDEAGDYKHIHGSGYLDNFQICFNIQEELSGIVNNAMKHLAVAEGSNVYLDISSAADNVEVSPDLKVAIGIENHNNCIVQTSQTFESYQVLSSTSFYRGRHYWEVDIVGSNNFRIGMCYASIDRRGPPSVIGNAGNSWCLVHSDGRFSLRHLNNDIDLDHHESFIKRLGIYLDYEAGRLSFYEMCDSIHHLHTFTTIFTEPLHAVFRVGLGVWARIRT